MASYQSTPLHRVSLSVADGTSLSVLDFGGGRPLAVFLHGLAGHAGEWTRVAGAMQPSLGKIAFDQRGHGHSSRRPGDLSRAACVADAVAVIERYTRGRRPVFLVGQSLGGHTAMLVAARHPELVDRLVMIEASPEGPTATGIERARRWLREWPRPLRTVESAVDFLGPAAPAWLAGMERRSDGWWPRFDQDTMLAVMEAAAGAWWREWDAVGCPTLLVRGQMGWISDQDVARMLQSGPGASLETVARAGHDVHLDAPAALARLINAFLV